MGGQRTPDRLAERRYPGPLPTLALGPGRVLGHGRDEVAEFQFQLVKELAAAFR